MLNKFVLKMIKKCDHSVHLLSTGLDYKELVITL